MTRATCYVLTCRGELGIGIERARVPGMPLNNSRNLKCWQLANDLRSQIIAICEMEAVKNDFKFCNGFRDAAGSVCRNLSEGFRRFTSSYIVQFFGYALASLEEI